MGGGPKTPPPPHEEKSKDEGSKSWLACDWIDLIFRIDLGPRVSQDLPGPSPSYRIKADFRKIFEEFETCFQLLVDLIEFADD